MRPRAAQDVGEITTCSGVWKIFNVKMASYRVNSGTAFYIGYDDHYQQYEQFHEQVNITDRGYLQTNRANFTKIQYLFRY